MSKNEVKREMLRQNIMKEVIFRIDYIGIISINDTIKDFATNFNGRFKSYIKTFNNRIDLGNIEIEEISETLSIPVKELQRLEIHRFAENTFGTDELTFDITNNYTVLYVKCKEYQTIDLYLDYFVDFIAFLIAKNEYISIKRFGLRKIGYLVNNDIGELLSNFEDTYYHTKIENDLFGTIGNNYVDILLSIDKIFNFTYRRVIDRGFIQNESGIMEAMRGTLDIDGYINEREIQETNFTDKHQCKSLIKKLNDLYLFELFKLSVTDKFLKENSNDGN